MQFSSTQGLDLGQVFNSGIDSIGQRGKDLQADMKSIMGKKEVSPEDMIRVQFEMGQYNTLVESLSSVTKSLTDMLKSLSQRAG